MGLLATFYAHTYRCGVLNISQNTCHEVVRRGDMGDFLCNSCIHVYIHK